MIYKSLNWVKHKDKIIDILCSDNVRELVNTGKATLAMIRPNIANSVKTELLDGKDAIDVIEQNIKELTILLKFNFIFDDQAMHEFYNGQSQINQMQRPPERDFEKKNRWDEFIGIMTGGPVTVYILASDTDNAINLWRRQVGSWDIEKQADPNTLRGKFGIHNYNNLLHGSDSAQEVHREIQVIINCVKRSNIY